MKCINLDLRFLFGLRALNQHETNFKKCFFDLPNLRKR